MTFNYLAKTKKLLTSFCALTYVSAMCYEPESAFSLRDTYDGGLGSGIWCIFHVAVDMECSSAA